MKSQYSSMLLFVFSLIIKATTHVELEIQTCNDQLGANQGRVAEGFFRFHGTEGEIALQFDCGVFYRPKIFLRIHGMAKMG